MKKKTIITWLCPPWYRDAPQGGRAVRCIFWEGVAARPSQKDAAPIPHRGRIWPNEFPKTCGLEEVLGISCNNE